jgi:class 3 adenylate cyclase/tetratricopeptide (TPR) repeat protein
MPAEVARSSTGTATILFTDLVGSTTLRTQLGEERAEVHRQAHHQLLAQAIASHGGTIHDNLGDGIMASFAGASDAVSGAVAIQQAITADGKRAGRTPVGIRIGISAGDVAWEASHPHGIPLVEAARLCAAAEGGQILVADIVRVLARGRGGHTFASIGPIALEGLPEPLSACAVGWEPLAGAGVPLPSRLGARPAFVMVGRAVEAEALALAWAKAQDGQRQVVLLAGEPGIGKTGLATETARAAHEGGATVLFGSSEEDVGVPYRPFVEALRHYVAHAPEEVLAEHVKAHRGELARLVPELAERVADLPAPQLAEAETERFLLFEAVTGLLAAASSESPIVLVLDDLHWARSPELLLLKHLIRSPESIRLLVIGTYRDTDLSRTHPLTAVLADLRRESGVERVPLHGLDDAAVETLMAAVVRHELDDALVGLAHALRAETEGNPFFIGEVIRHLRESSALLHEEGRWMYRGAIADLGIPESVREVIGRRLGRLSETTSRMLSLAAGIGRQFDVALLAKIADTSEDAVLDALDESMAAALVSEVRGSAAQFAFRHALIRTTLYEELSATRRARLHRRIGEALEDLVQGKPGTRIEELAYHWLAATPATDAEKAIGYARQAGQRALAGLAFEEAAAHFERALAVLEPRDEDGRRLHCDLLLALGDVQRRAGNTSYRGTVATAVEVARTLGDGERLARAVLGHARSGGIVANVTVVDEALLALYEEARVALGDVDSPLRVQVLGQLAAELAWTPERERRHALSREAVAIARRLGEPRGLGQALNLRHLAIGDPFTLGERLDLTAELAALAARVGSRELAWYSAWHRGGALLESGDIGGAEQSLAEVERLAGELRQAYYKWLARLGRAMLAILRGAPDAEAEAFAAFELGRAGGQPDAAAAFGTQVSVLRSYQGRLGELIDVLRANVDAQPHIPAWRSVLARAYCDTDQLAEARAQLDALRDVGLDSPPDAQWTSVVVAMSPVISDLRDRSAAAVLYERMRPIANQVEVFSGDIVSRGSYGQFCGMLAACLGRWDDAERHFTDGLAMNERLGARPANARTRAAWAAMLLDRNAPGDTARARDLIAAGRAEAEQLGMARELVRFDRLTQRFERPPA